MRGFCSARGGAFWALALAALAGCREAPSPFDSADRTPLPDRAGLRLTFSLGRDRSPVWNAAGDTLYYVAQGVYPGIPQSRGVLVGVPERGGSANAILQGKQLGLSNPRFFTAPAVSADGKTSAYVELTEVADYSTDCRNSCSVSTDTAFTTPLLVRGALRVTRLDPAVLSDEASLTIAFEGRLFDTQHREYNLLGTWIWVSYPYQRRFAREGAQVFRPSWSPDGKRLVFSDGLRLYTWTLGEASARVIPGTVDGAWPAWSPDGQTIAYTRLLRNDSSVTTCHCVTSRGGIAELQRRIVYEDDVDGQGALILIRPDGSGLRVIGEGDAPAWTPNGSLVFRRAGSLWQANGAGGQARRILHTEGAWEPAVSRDGRKVAFTRTSDGNADIWVVPLVF